MDPIVDTCTPSPWFPSAHDPKGIATAAYWTHTRSPPLSGSNGPNRPARARATSGRGTHEHCFRPRETLSPGCPEGFLKILGARGVSRPTLKQTSKTVTLLEEAWGHFKVSAPKCMTTHFFTPPGGAFKRLTVISVCHKASWGSFAFRRAPRENSRFWRSSRVCKALPRGASPGRLNASRVSQTNRANSRRTLQTFRNASSPQGIQGGGFLWGEALVVLQIWLWV